MKPQRIVIVGGGFGGAYCARGLVRAGVGREAEIVLVDRHNYFLFYPLLVEAGIGELEPRHVTVPIRAFLPGATFRMAEVQGVDFDRQEVIFQGLADLQPHRVRYDQLVIALGSVTQLPDVPGLRQHGFELKGLGDAVALRDRAIALAEAAASERDPARRRALLHFVVVGANFTGTEVAGEFDVYLRELAHRHPELDPSDCRITLVEITDRILPAVDADLANYARQHLIRRGVDIRLRTSVERVEPEHVMLEGGEQIATHTLIWCAGIAPNPLLNELPLPKDKRGYLLCEPDLRVRGCERVWAIGDGAVNCDPDGKPYPATAQHAVREGQHLARNVARILRGSPAEPFHYRAYGSVAAVGCRTGVAKIFGLKLAGFSSIQRRVHPTSHAGDWSRAGDAVAEQESRRPRPCQRLHSVASGAADARSPGLKFPGSTR
jgi:NADH:ubiquinone reductase (H+-translocating)